MFQIVHWECATVILYRSNLSGAGLDFFFFFSEFIMGVYTFLKKGPLSQIKTSVMLRNRQAFHLPILCCNSEHVAAINGTVKSRVCVWVVFFLFFNSLGQPVFHLQTHQAPDSHVYKDVDGHFI